MNPAVLKALTGNASLDEFIRARGQAISNIGTRRRGYRLRTTVVDGHIHTELNPKFSREELERQRQHPAMLLPSNERS